MSRPQCLHVGGDAQRGETRYVVGMHDLEVSDVVPLAARAVGGQRRLDRVERLAHRTVPDGVKVHLESLGV